MNALPKLSLTEAIMMLESALRSDAPIHWIGAPGIGKTAIMGQIAQRMGVPLYSLILSQCDPSDVGGVPVPVSMPDGTRAIVRLPIGPIAQACAKPGILFLDEMSQSSLPLQGAGLRLVNERDAGDVRLHAQTRIAMASNPLEQSANGQEMSAPMRNRIRHIRVEPTRAEVQSYLFGLGAEGSALRASAVDYAMTLEMSPGLLQLEPPAGANTSEALWASPRSIERACRGLADLAENKIPEGKMWHALLTGDLGPDVAGAYMAIRKVRDRLPSRPEILADPEGAKAPGPKEIDVGIAALGVLGQVALEDACAAWVYAERLSAEVRVAAGRALIKFPLQGKSKFHTQASRARARMLGSTSGVLANSQDD